MIKSFSLNTNSGHIHHAFSIDKLKETIHFSDGVNIIFGNNGSGKTTLTSLLAKHLFAKQGGLSLITPEALSEHFSPKSALSAQYRDAISQIIHDGQPVLYGNPLDTLGVDDYGREDRTFVGIESMLLQYDSQILSHGQKTIRKMNMIMSIINCEYHKEAFKLDKKIQRLQIVLAEKLEKHKDAHWHNRSARKDISNAKLKLEIAKKERQMVAIFPDEIKSSFSEHQINDYFKPMYEKALRLIEPQCEKGKKTIILDEPETGLSLPLQYAFWNNVVPKAAKQYQLIIATHSPFAVNVESANYVEMSDGYLAQCRKILGKG
jgi:predicted ATPase